MNHLNLIIAQAAGSGASAVVILIICIIVFIIIFLAIRSLVLWYWKVYDIIENQTRTNALLEEQNQLLRAYLKSKDN